MNRVWLVAGFIGLLIAWGFGAHAPFVYDDKLEVIGNPSLRVYTDLRALLTYNVSRPLLIASYAANWAVGGLDPFVYHLTSMGIHLVNVCLVGLVLAQRTSARIAWCAALLWGVHPMCVQGVTYITGRSDALCATFWLGASYTWLRGHTRVTVGLVGAALLTKELAILLPVWLWLLRPEGYSRRFLAAMAAMVLGGAVTRVGFMGWPQVEVQRPLIDQFASQGDAWTRYLTLWIVPFGQSILHDPPLDGARRILSAVLAVVWAYAIALLMFRWWRKRDDGLALGGLLIACWVLPASAIPLKETMAEHRAYLVGVPLIAALVTWLQKRQAMPMVAVAFVLFGALTLRQNRLWSDEVLLWRRAAELYPQSADATFGHADALRFAKRWADAEKGFRAVLELRPDDEHAAINLGIMRAEQGDEAGAAEIWTALSRTHPTSCAAHNNLGAFALRQGQRRQAMDEYNSALQWCPTDPVALLNLGHLNWERGDTMVARKYYVAYLENLPFGAEAALVRDRIGG